MTGDLGTPDDASVSVLAKVTGDTLVLLAYSPGDPERVTVQLYDGSAYIALELDESAANMLSDQIDEAANVLQQARHRREEALANG